MRQLGILLLAILLGASLCYGQSSATSVAGTPGAIGRGAFPVRVTKTMDSSKLRQDDTIQVETAGSFKLPDGTLVPKGSKLIGRVTEAKARSKGDSDSELTLVFNKLETSGGQQVTVKGSVQAVYPPAEETGGPDMATAGTSAGGSGAGGGSGGVGLTNTKSGSDMQSSSRPQGVMDMKAVGVQGVHDLELDNGVLTSKGKSVKLGGGMRMIVRAEVFGS